MSALSVHALDNKHIRISGIDPVLAACLYELPEILLKRDDPAPHHRLFPPPTDDTKANEEWDRLIAPELRHLLVSAGEVVQRDLTGLKLGPGNTSRLRVTFPSDHVNAWMSALNQARLILGELHGVEEPDMAPEHFDMRDPKHHAVLKIHVLGFLLQLLVELESGDD